MANFQKKALNFMVNCSTILLFREIDKNVTEFELKKMSLAINYLCEYFCIHLGVKNGFEFKQLNYFKEKPRGY